MKKFIPALFLLISFLIVALFPVYIIVSSIELKGMIPDWYLITNVVGGANIIIFLITLIIFKRYF